MESVGIVGVGAMGSAILERLLAAGKSPIVYDPFPSAVEKARSKGARVASSAAEAAGAEEIVHVVVRTDEEVQESVLGSRGVLEGARSGTLLLLHSTVRPQTTQAVAKEAARSGVSVIDACMVGRPDVVRAGEMCFLVGGPADLVERVRPHLLTIGRKVIHVGPLGMGNVAKILKNLLTGSEALLVYETIRIGAAAGLAEREALEILREMGSGPNVLNHWQETFVESSDGLAPRVGSNMYDKDLPLASELARSLGVHAPITAALAETGLRLVAAKAQRSS
jgi:3-hydroxyisobutyrate dehydrogenase-like beta-hydroxyacid dehydrogenase